MRASQALFNEQDKNIHKYYKEKGTKGRTFGEAKKHSKCHKAPSLHYDYKNR